MTNTVSRIISDETLSRAIQIESGGRAGAKARTSSALGLMQFLGATWLETVVRHRPDWLARKTREQVLALRLDARCSIELGARFWEDNAALLGEGWSDGDLYLAHFAGAATARRLLRASPSAPAASVFSEAAIGANRSILSGKTCGEVRSWAAHRMAAAGGRNWVAVYMTGAPRPMEPALKRIATASTAGTAAAAAAAHQASSVRVWLSAAAAIALLAGIAVLVWRSRARARLIKLEPSEEGDGLD